MFVAWLTTMSYTGIVNERFFEKINVMFKRDVCSLPSLNNNGRSMFSGTWLRSNLIIRNEVRHSQLICAIVSCLPNNCWQATPIHPSLITILILPTPQLIAKTTPKLLIMLKKSIYFINCLLPIYQLTLPSTYFQESMTAATAH